jgi:hypothetical protein
MQLDREPDVADVTRHVVADAKPPALGPFHAVDAAVVLLVEPVGSERVQPHAVRVVAELRLRVGKECRETARVERVPVGAAVGAFEHAAARQADV